MTTLSIDYSKFADALRYCMEHPTQGVDTLTAAVRRAAGDQSIVLTAEQRREVKQASYAVLYDASGSTFISMLKRNQN